MRAQLYVYVSSLLFSFPIAAVAESYLDTLFDAKVSGMLAVTSDYVPRGITQSDERPAQHASANYERDSGVYLSVGATSISYYYDDAVFVEGDIYSGYKFTHAGLNFDIGVRGYVYPGADSNRDYNFFETRVAIGKNFKYGSITGAIQYSPNYWYRTGNSLYVPINANIPLKDGLNLIGKVAHQSVQYNDRFGIPDYWNWSAGVSGQYKSYGASLEYMDTDLHKSELRDGAEPRIVLTLMRFF